ncbi:O-antigen ligase family protein [Patescibacteria group bacterium]
MTKDSKKLPSWLLLAAIIGSLIGAGLAAYFSWLAIPITIGLIIFLSLVILIFDKPWLGVVLVAFFLPFERIGGFDVVGQTTLKTSQVFVVVTIASWLLYYLIIRRQSNPRTAIMWPLLAYLGIAAISIVNAQNLERAMAVYVFSAFVIIFALVIPQVIRNTAHIKKVVIVLLFSALIVSLFGLYQFVGDVIGLPPELTGLREHYTQSVFGFPRIHSTALEPLYFANYLLIPIAITFLLWLRQPKTQPESGRWQKFFSRRIVLLGIFLFCILSLSLTLSRGGYLGLLATMVILLILGWRQIFTMRNFYILLLVGIIMVLIAVAFINFSGRFSLDTFLTQATEYQTGASIEERYSTYNQAQQLFATHPIFGVGIGNFGPEVATYYQRMPEGGWLIVNNEPLEILAETGILGLAAILGMVIILLWQTIRALWISQKISNESQRIFLRAILGGFLAAFVGILVQYQTFSTLYILHVWFVIGMMATTVIVINKLVEPALEKD